jgi:hypothetical protein
VTGPEHYREAERIMKEMTLVDRGKTQELGFPEAMAMAQVHAILALAAATGMASGAGEWFEATAPLIPAVPSPPPEHSRPVPRSRPVEPVRHIDPREQQ